MEHVRHEYIIHRAERIIGSSLFSHQDVYDSISREQTGKIIRPLTPCHHRFEAWDSKYDSKIKASDVQYESSSAGEILLYIIILLFKSFSIIN